MSVKVTLASIQMDTSIQCRAHIDMAVVNDYAERMEAGDKFPPVELYGTAAKNWPGDGWHRIDAARSMGHPAISANLHKGGRVDALKHALGANALHGHRRTNADKRRCVEIALAEFPKMGDNAIAKLCGVDNHTVMAVRHCQEHHDEAWAERRNRLGTSQPEKRTGSDGKQYPARRAPGETEEPRKEREPQTTEESREMAPPADGISCAELAITHLEQVRPEDSQRKQAWNMMREWLNEHE